MFKKSLIIIIPALAIGAFFFNNSNKSEKHPQKVVVAITQIAPHPSLDRIRAGIVDTLKQNGISENQIIFQNAQGNPATALQIAQKFASLHPSLIVPITTPSAQAAVSTAKASGVPVVFSAVNDPVSAKLVDESLTSEFVAGVSDFPPVDEQIQLIVDLFGTNIDIGIIYNAGEANSVSVVAQFTSLAKERSMQVFTATASSTNDVGTAAQSLISKGVRAIYIPNDNTVISALESVFRAVSVTKTPIITADPESVKKGALATVSHDQYQLGVDTGNIIVDVLNHRKSIREIGVRRPKETLLAINLDTATKSNIVIPEDLKKRAKFIIQPQGQ